jgi:hypothetical protein
MSPKIMRRQREEPEVAAFVKIPKPEIFAEIVSMSPDPTAFRKYDPAIEENK